MPNPFKSLVTAALAAGVPDSFLREVKTDVHEDSRIFHHPESYCSTLSAKRRNNVNYLGNLPRKAVKIVDLAKEKVCDDCVRYYYYRSDPYAVASSYNFLQKYVEDCKLSDTAFRYASSIENKSMKNSRLIKLQREVASSLAKAPKKIDKAPREMEELEKISREKLEKASLALKALGSSDTVKEKIKKEAKENMILPQYKVTLDETPTMAVLLGRRPSMLNSGQIIDAFIVKDEKFPCMVMPRYVLDYLFQNSEGELIITAPGPVSLDEAETAFGIFDPFSQEMGSLINALSAARLILGTHQDGQSFLK